MKILLVTTSYPSVEAPHNGVFIREHARALLERGHEVHVLVPRVFRADPLEADEHGVTVHRFDFWSEGKLLTEYESIPVMRMASYLVSGCAAGVRLARKLDPDVVHGHWVIPAGLIALAASRLPRRTPLVVTAHRKDIEVAQSGSRIAYQLARLVLFGADKVVAVSAALRDTLVERFGVAPRRVSIVPMGVDTVAFRPSGMRGARDKLGIALDARLVLFVGGLIPVKGVADLIAAMPEVVSAVPKAQLALAGHGPLAEELRAAAVERGLADNVRFLGAVPHDELPMWMNAADVLVLPSYSEGLPVCLMEAAAVGLPMVATDVGGSAEVVALAGCNTLLTPGDVDGIAQAVVSVLDEPFIDRCSMLDTSPRFTLEGSLEQILTLYGCAAPTAEGA